MLTPPPLAAAHAGDPPTRVSTLPFDPTPRRCGVPEDPPAMMSPKVVIGLVMAEAGVGVHSPVVELYSSACPFVGLVELTPTP
jgi:hypothetical protein